MQARKKEIEAGLSEDERKHDAATAIQKTWQSYNLKLGCVIIIQASSRQYLAKKAVDSKLVSDTLVASAAQELRERNASKRSFRRKSHS
jgi:hypothetical protein